MPKIYEYLGIVIMFYANEHEPIHIHAKYGDRQNKAEFTVDKGKVVKIEIKSVGNAEPLRDSELKKLNEFLKAYADEIIRKWVDFFVYKKKISFERITKKIK